MERLICISSILVVSHNLTNIFYKWHFVYCYCDSIILNSAGVMSDSGNSSLFIFMKCKYIHTRNIFLSLWLITMSVSKTLIVQVMTFSKMRDKHLVEAGNRDHYNYTFRHKSVHKESQNNT